MPPRHSRRWGILLLLALPPWGLAGQGFEDARGDVSSAYGTAIAIDGEVGVIRP